MERLDGKGIINGEWHRIKEMMERAHNLEARGGDDDLDMSWYMKYRVYSYIWSSAARAMQLEQQSQ